jgi:hypothetical protein
VEALLEAAARLVMVEAAVCLNAKALQTATTGTSVPTTSAIPRMAYATTQR